MLVRAKQTSSIKRSSTIEQFRSIFVFLEKRSLQNPDDIPMSSPSFSSSSRTMSCTLSSVFVLLRCSCPPFAPTFWRPDPGDVSCSIFCDLCKPIIIRSVYVISPSSSPFHDILDLADIANVFAADSISQSVVNDAP